VIDKIEEDLHHVKLGRSCSNDGFRLISDLFLSRMTTNSTHTRTLHKRLLTSRPSSRPPPPEALTAVKTPETLCLREVDCLDHRCAHASWFGCSYLPALCSPACPFIFSFRSPRRNYCKLVHESNASPLSRNHPVTWSILLQLSIRVSPIEPIQSSQDAQSPLCVCTVHLS
jgi:hypothetical protein